jgi:hypothetical protein
MGESRPQKSEQDDKWSFCLTAGTLCPAGGGANVVGNGRGAIPGNMKLSFQAARSIG